MGARDLAIFEQNNKLDKQQNALKDYVGLIEVLNDKVGLQNDVMNETKNSLLKKMANIEKNVIQKLDSGNTPDLSFNLRSYEDTITKLEQEVSSLSKDFLIYREQATRELREGLETISQTRDDYIERISRIYSDQESLVQVIDENSKKVGTSMKSENLLMEEKLKRMRGIVSDLEAKMIEFDTKVQTCLDYKQDQTDQYVEIGERIARYASEIASQKAYIGEMSKTLIMNMADLVGSV